MPFAPRRGWCRGDNCAGRCEGASRSVRGASSGDESPDEFQTMVSSSLAAARESHTPSLGDVAWPQTHQALTPRVGGATGSPPSCSSQRHPQLVGRHSVHPSATRRAVARIRGSSLADLCIPAQHATGRSDTETWRGGIRGAVHNIFSIPAPHETGWHALWTRRSSVSSSRRHTRPGAPAHAAGCTT